MTDSVSGYIGCFIQIDIEVDIIIILVWGRKDPLRLMFEDSLMVPK